MLKYAIEKMELYRVIDEQTGTITHGCDQEWYPTKWQRMSGCGPSVISGISLYYELLSSPAPAVLTRGQCIERMQQVWRYVTPSFKGVSSTGMLSKGALAFAKTNGSAWQAQCLNIPKRKAMRPALEDVLGFIGASLHSSLPVAFLNLHNGTIDNLDAWHWVTLVSLDTHDDGRQAQCVIIDEGMLKQMDLAQWYHTTKLGGGFVRFDRPGLAYGGADAQ